MGWVGKKNKTFHESLKRGEHLLVMRQGFRRALQNNREQWEIGSIGRMGMRIQKRTAATRLTKNYVSSGKASPEPLVSFFLTDEPFNIFISFPRHSDSTVYHSVTLFLLFSTFSSYCPKLFVWLNTGEYLSFPVHANRMLASVRENHD